MKTKFVSISAQKDEDYRSVKCLVNQRYHGQPEVAARAYEEVCAAYTSREFKYIRSTPTALLAGVEGRKEITTFLEARPLISSRDLPSLNTKGAMGISRYLPTVVENQGYRAAEDLILDNLGKLEGVVFKDPKSGRIRVLKGQEKKLNEWLKEESGNSIPFRKSVPLESLSAYLHRILPDEEQYELAYQTTVNHMKDLTDKFIQTPVNPGAPDKRKILMIPGEEDKYVVWLSEELGDRINPQTNLTPEEDLEKKGYSRGEILRRLGHRSSDSRIIDYIGELVEDGEIPEKYVIPSKVKGKETHFRIRPKALPLLEKKLAKKFGATNQRDSLPAIPPAREEEKEVDPRQTAEYSARVRQLEQEEQIRPGQISVEVLKTRYDELKRRADRKELEVLPPSRLITEFGIAPGKVSEKSDVLGSPFAISNNGSGYEIRRVLNFLEEILSSSS